MPVGDKSQWSLSGESMSKTVLITGASSGIGKELARLFAADDHNLVLAARRVDVLETLASELSTKYKIKAHPMGVDLSQPADIDRFFNDLKRKKISIDVLVNNAGFGASGSFTEIDFETQLDQIRVNISALTDLTYRLVPGMIKRKSGGIMNIASVAAFSPGPYMAVYYATKAYVLSFSTALANELGEKGITVTCVCPGPTKTGFGERANVSQNGIFNTPMVMDVEPVARLAFDGFKSGDELVITGVQNKILALASRVAPFRLSAYITRKFNYRII